MVEGTYRPDAGAEQDGRLAPRSNPSRASPSAPEPKSPGQGQIVLRMGRVGVKTSRSTKGKGRGLSSKQLKRKFRNKFNSLERATGSGPGRPTARKGRANKKKPRRTNPLAVRARTHKFISQANRAAGPPKHLYASNGRIKCYIRLAWEDHTWVCNKVDSPFMTFMIGWNLQQVTLWLNKAYKTGWYFNHVARKDLPLKELHEWMT